MAAGYYLSTADRDKLRADHRRLNAGRGSQRPVAKRRRGPRGGGGGGGRMLRGLTTAAVSGGDFNGDSIEMLFGADPRSDPGSGSETVAIVNDFAMSGDNNAPFVAVYQPGSDSWLCIQLKCPAPA